MAGSVDFALNNDAVVTVVTVDEQGEDRSDEEKDDVPDYHVSACMHLVAREYLHDTESPGCFEHSTLTVNVESI
jgi:hypothetical protein